ncbi:MAG: mechanosensitive ion channel family protein [Treponema sp.]|jgi:small-conductance mechanosensitive channel|nr:mechanosensitive ion channel family protein [Treponema sp.]
MLVKKAPWFLFLFGICLAFSLYGDTGAPGHPEEPPAPPEESAVQAPRDLPPGAPAAPAPAAEPPGPGLASPPAEDKTLPAGVADLLIRLGRALLIVILQVLLIWLVWRGFKRITRRITERAEKNLKPLAIKKLHILSTKQIIRLIELAVRIVKFIVVGFQLFLTLPLVFSSFPETKDLAFTLFDYILIPLKGIALGLIGYIPNLIAIVIILIVTRYAQRGLKFFASQIELERLVLPGFYPDWAQPTFNILRVLLYAFTMVVIYPYLPGSGSPVFQGVSVFVGIIFSMGSTSAIGNLIAGFVITYMRPFKIGDRIQVQNITGFVVEKSLIVIRLRTHKNEYVTFPNLMILNSNIINYNSSAAAEEEGLILYAEITMGYSVPWPRVHELLLGAALRTNQVLQTPKPYVLQTALDDNYARYQINVYTKAVHRVPAIYSELYQHIQDAFREADLEFTAPSYHILLPSDLPNFPYVRSQGNAVPPMNAGPAAGIANALSAVSAKGFGGA